MISYRLKDTVLIECLQQLVRNTLLSQPIQGRFCNQELSIPKPRYTASLHKAVKSASGILFCRKLKFSELHLLGNIKR